MRCSFSRINFIYYPTHWLLKPNLSHNPRNVFEIELSGEIRPGDWIHLSGANGAGKSTLLRILAGILKPSSGSISLNSRCLSLFSESIFHPELSLKENFYFYSSLQNFSYHKAMEKLSLQLSHKSFALDRPYGHFSQGQRAQFALSVALSLGPDLLLIDEQTQHLDQESEEYFLSQLINFTKDGGAIVMTSHKSVHLASINWHLNSQGLKPYLTSLST
jgi:ABC-2 type transport system ATP-binding protein